MSTCEILRESGRMIRTGIKESIRSGQVYTGQIQRGIERFSYRVGDLRDKPGYASRGGRWVRVTGDTPPGLSELDRFQAGYRLGTWSKTLALIRSWF